MTLEPQSAATGREMRGWRLFCHLVALHVWHWRLSRWLPRLVWINDEVDVRITFSQHKLNPDDPMRSLFSGDLYEIEKHLHALGLSFDTGCGCDGRDWEWDFSLHGPVSVKFRRRAEHPERRQERPRPRLIFSRKP